MVSTIMISLLYYVIFNMSDILKTYGLEKRNIAEPFLDVSDIIAQLWLTLSDFDDKNITDIGAWISPLSTHIAKSSRCKSMTFVDPIYDALSVEQLHKKNKEYILRKIGEEWRKASESDPDVFFMAWKHIENILKSSHYSALYSNINNLKKTEELIDERKNWKPHNIILNHSDGKKIENIDSNSQDYVIIQYVLNNLKGMFDETDILREAKRILAKEGYLIIVNPGNYTKKVIPWKWRWKILNNVSYICIPQTDI